MNILKKHSAVSFRSPFAQLCLCSLIGSLFCRIGWLRSRRLHQRLRDPSGTSKMGFGGVGESGMGEYHGKCGFDTFSHTKSIVDKKTWIDLPMRYQPYRRGLYGKLLHMFLK